MPSLDVIRNVTIKGRADGVDDATAALNRLTASIQATSQNLSLMASRGANDNLKQIADNTEALNRQMLNLDQSTRAAAENGGGSFLGWVAKIALGVAAAQVGLSALYAGFKLLYEVVTLGPRLLAEAWELGNAKLAEYVALSEKATASGVSTDFYQRIAKAATDAKTPIDALTEAFKKLNDASAATLGGTAAQNRLTELVKAGNFSGNSGVGQLQNANSNEERLRAIASLVDQALEKGQRLAAIDITRSFLGDQAAANLAKDSGYLDDMIEKADSIKSQDLVSAGTIANAVELQNRLDAAEKILSQRWHPIQDLLTQLGIKMKETWVDIVEAIAKAVDAVFRLGEKIAEALSPVMGFLKTAGELWAKASPYLAIAAASTPVTAPIAPAVAASGYLFGDRSGTSQADAQREALLADARKRLAEGLNRKFDTSHAPGNDNTPDTSAYDRATESLRKYIETSDAAAKSTDLTVDAQERLKAIAQLTAAGMKDGLTREAAAAKAELSGLAQQAGNAALALEKARVDSEIKFGRNTSLLSQDDVQIATRLKGLYPDVATALGSVQAQGMRANNAFKEIGSTIETNLTQGLTDIVSGSKSAGDAFANMGKSIVTAIEQMIIKIMIVQPLMQALQSTISGGFSGLFGGGGGAPSGMGGIGHFHAGGIVGSEATFSRSVSPAAFAAAPRFHGGGIAGDEVPIIARRGEGVFTAGQMAALGASKAPQVTVNMIEDSSRAGQTQQRNNDNGGLDLTVFVDSITAKNAANPGSATSRVLDQRGRLAAR